MIDRRQYYKRPTPSHISEDDDRVLRDVLETALYMQGVPDDKLQDTMETYSTQRLFTLAHGLTAVNRGRMHKERADEWPEPTPTFKVRLIGGPANGQYHHTPARCLTIHWPTDDGGSYVYSVDHKTLTAE
jgi:hypothetical protein